MFIDSAEISLKAGDGGNGAISFHREKYVSNGGPDGGDGGAGGNIIFIATRDMRTLADFRYKRHYKAERGQDGSSSNCTGRGGENLIIKVPCGTIIKEKNSSRIIADLTDDGQSKVVAKGGHGGKGNQHFATPTRQAPNFAKTGTLGEEIEVLLELKLLADVGLVGFPNVGKSTILSIVSSAKPKIANYHFTTLKPNLGVVSLGEGNSFVVADIPGLIEGAHEGVGLGHEFLKHVERTKLLLHVIDVAGLDGRDPIEDYEIINSELNKYNIMLEKRYQIVAANKIDVLGGQTEELERFTKYIEEKGHKVFPISAATNMGIKELLQFISVKLKDIPDTVLFNPEEEEKLYTIEDNRPPVEITIDEKGVYIIKGKWVEKIMRGVNYSDIESLNYLHRSLKNKGVFEKLEEMGISEGDTVSIFDFEFDYVR